MYIEKDVEKRQVNLVGRVKNILQKHKADILFKTNTKCK